MRTTRMVMMGLLLSGGLTGCFSSGDIVGYAVDRTVDRAADRVGDEIGKAVVASMLANNPELLYAYSMSVFQVMFYQGGYYYTGVENFEPGEWARWDMKGYAEANTAERALLKRLEDGSEWWRVETRTVNDQGTEDVVVMEVLFTAAAEDGTRRVVRMRSLLPGNAEPQEVPITEQDSERWVVRGGQTLTKESAAGMTVSEGVEVSTKAGTFKCRHLQTKSTDGKVTLDWYLNDDVPGQYVRYTSHAEGDVQYESELVATGKDATASKLGSF